MMLQSNLGMWVLDKFGWKIVLVLDSHTWWERRGACWTLNGSVCDVGPGDDIVRVKSPADLADVVVGEISGEEGDELEVIVVFGCDASFVICDERVL